MYSPKTIKKNAMLIYWVAEHTHNICCNQHAILQPGTLKEKIQITNCINETKLHANNEEMEAWQ